ncbi:SRPBCC family protein [Alkalibacillus haloalkaliphilus]|uniref:SRPBCC family protein n=1 Tax=Alkalibacillus haloalkaliphilus TaxID=94136 RepID=A0A511W939_9BACI|nr:SRPBCC family protein [Alkalibacillus haloalkaliphilus]GEN46868.1 hypothetical protein AHA02nite_26440 [Alkalibacillus haloalkaliphilus]
MLTWKEKRRIPTNIETVWALFQPDQLQRIMPKVVEHELIEGEQGQVGSKHKQSYQEGERVETYIVETLAYEDKEDYKHLTMTFNIGKAFKIERSYTIITKGSQESLLTYEGANRGTNWFGKLFLKLAPSSKNDQVVQEFLDRVVEEAEKEQTGS